MKPDLQFQNRDGHKVRPYNYSSVGAQAGPFAKWWNPTSGRVFHSELETAQAHFVSGAKIGCSVSGWIVPSGL